MAYLYFSFSFIPAVIKSYTVSNLSADHSASLIGYSISQRYTSYSSGLSYSYCVSKLGISNLQQVLRYLRALSTSWVFKKNRRDKKTIPCVTVSSIWLIPGTVHNFKIRLHPINLAIDPNKLMGNTRIQQHNMALLIMRSQIKKRMKIHHGGFRKFFWIGITQQTLTESEY